MTLLRDGPFPGLCPLVQAFRQGGGFIDTT